jgi:hypothetical protein
MSIVNYGVGVLYGAGTASYGRISATLAAAQVADVRETGLQVSLIDEHLNAWELFAGTWADLLTFYRNANGGTQADQLSYYSYRGGASMDLLSNGHIVRTRNGDPANISDRQIYVQEITDPFNASQWTTWSLLYSGTHYNAKVVANGTSYNVYHSKSDGLYINNVKKVDNSLAPNGGQILLFAPLAGGNMHEGWITTLVKDATDNKRVIDIYYCPDVSAGSPTLTADLLNFRWVVIGNAGHVYNGQILRFISGPWYFDPRNGDVGNSVQICIADRATPTDFGPPILLRGLGGGIGHNRMSAGLVLHAADGYHYLFGGEYHEDKSYQFISNLTLPLFWQRSKDMIHWTDATFTGTVHYGFAGVVETQGYWWMADAQQVWRRPTAVSTYDISNYVTHVDFDLPRDNQAATGQMTVANPNGINDALKTLSDKELVLNVGIRGTSGAFEYTKFNRWFVSQVDSTLENPANRLQLTFGDLWARMDNDFRDTLTLVGQINWRDWGLTGARNRAFNYYFVSDAAPVESATSLKTKGICLFTGWKGPNGSVQGHFSSVTGTTRSLIFRYLDSKNYCAVVHDSSADTVKVTETYKNVTTTIVSPTGVSHDTSPTLKVEFTFWRIRVWFNGSLVINGLYPNNRALSRPGYVGFKATKYTLTQVTVDEFEQVLTTRDLLTRALAMADFHDVLVSSGDSRQLGIQWGPQTDLSTPAAAMAAALQADKLQLIWRDGVVEIGKFTDQTIVKTIQDTVIESGRVDNANKQINFASVDGETESWLEYDATDLQRRGREVNKYFDLPELLDQSAVTARAKEEIRVSKLGASPSGKTPLYFDLWRLDPVTWIDQLGNSSGVRIQGFQVTIEQGARPSQRQAFDFSLLETASQDAMDNSTPSSE